MFVLMCVKTDYLTGTRVEIYVFIRVLLLYFSLKFWERGDS